MVPVHVSIGSTVAMCGSGGPPPSVTAGSLPSVHGADVPLLSTPIVTGSTPGVPGAGMDFSLVTTGDLPSVCGASGPILSSTTCSMTSAPGAGVPLPSSHPAVIGSTPGVPGTGGLSSGIQAHSGSAVKESHVRSPLEEQLMSLHSQFSPVSSVIGEASLVLEEGFCDQEESPINFHSPKYTPPTIRRSASLAVHCRSFYGVPGTTTVHIILGEC